MELFNICWSNAIPWVRNLGLVLVRAVAQIHPRMENWIWEDMRA
jgi:hypothetical protein